MNSLDSITLAEKFDRWRNMAGKIHPTFIPLTNPQADWTPLRKPLAQCQVALVSTAGIHRKDQPAFDLLAHEGDWSYRELPSSSDSKDLMASHGHYDTDPANSDINCVFPIDRLRELAAEGVIGEIASTHFGLMGFIPDSRRLVEETAPVIAEKLANQGTDVVVLTPG